MESNKYNIENFERFLRDKTDEFRMYPSKRVWYSIYNNMHPGNRLPSVSMSIILIGFLFLVGYLNTSDAVKDTAEATQLNSQTAKAQAIVNSTAQKEKNNLFVAATTQAVNLSAEKNLISTIQNNRIVVGNNNGTKMANNLNTAFDQRNVSNSPETNTLVTNAIDLIEYQYASATINPYRNNAGKENRTAFNDVQNSTDILQKDETSTASANAIQENGFAGSNGNEDLRAGNHITLGNNIAGNEAVASLPAKTENPVPVKPDAPVAAKTNNNTLSLSDKAWMEDFALHNRPAQKWGGKLSVQAYITPSLVYRKLHDNTEGKTINGTPNVGVAVTHMPSFGLETGLSLQYDVAKKIKVKAGVQLNYTRYNAHAFETNHPVATTITMNASDGNSIYDQSRLSYYSNASGPSKVKLHNETYQVSLPVGADIKLASLDNILWYAGASIQPTFIVYGRSYIISADRRSYVQDGTLLNRFNLNAGFETYFSYKTNRGYTWQLGPQYRTQLFSTNSKVYSVEERLQNFGFKIGVTKKL